MAFYIIDAKVMILTFPLLHRIILNTVCGKKPCLLGYGKNLTE